MKMKAIFVVIVLLIGCSNATPAKRSTCTGCPKQLSGTLITETVPDSGPSTSASMKFNMDTALQIMQAEATVSGMTFNMVFDFKGKNIYITYPGGCHVEPLTTEENICDPAEFKNMKLVVSGKLGSKGASVDVYSESKDDTIGIVTLEAGNDCTPVSFASRDTKEGSCSSGSFLDLKLSADASKLKIPDACKQPIGRRSIPAMVHSLHVKKAMKRGFPWISAPLAARNGDSPGSTCKIPEKGDSHGPFRDRNHKKSHTGIDDFSTRGGNLD
ncbi:hypothetical protein OS493_022320 [Desmophyllum pertusum]|uniref:Uncharacterized protein n=1 Tax=Desmophyllum pertusum TaxID=174260 RepID=A0A9X0D7Z9_9CNID|nr:hypothetical protein OS493_022320 [Desmophyllum pertusum]